jgi:Spy/CpxP family protein refolding chaperone
MRYFSRLSCLFALLACAAFAYAQANNSQSNNAASSDPQAATPQTGHGQPTQEASIAERMQNLARQLNLTDAQKEKIEPILLDSAKQVDALRNDNSLTREQRFAKFRQIHESTLTQIRPVLTDEQQKKLDAMVAQMHQRPAGGPPQNRPKTQQPQ